MVTIKEEKLDSKMDLDVIKIKEDPEGNPSNFLNVFVNQDSCQGHIKEEDQAFYANVNMIDTENGGMVLQEIKVEQVEEVDPLFCEIAEDYVNIEPKIEPETTNVQMGNIVKCEIPAFSVTVEDFEQMEQNIEANAEECNRIMITCQDVGVGCNLDESDKNFFNQCQHCDNFEKTIASLLKHDCIKKGNSSECVICNRISNGVQNMKNHLHAVHNNIIKPCIKPDHSLPFQCKLCNKTFESAYRLRVHKFIHGLIKSFRCRICPKTFLKIDNVVKHEALHPELVRYPRKDFKGTLHLCRQCNLKFKTADELRRHEEEHLSSYCRICGVSFVTQKSYDFHVKKKHSKAKLSFICVECRQEFPKVIALQNHIQKMHRSN